MKKRKKEIGLLIASLIIFSIWHASHRCKSAKAMAQDFLAKECVEKFSGEVLESHFDEAMLCIGLPFHNPEGELLKCKIQKMHKEIVNQIPCDQIQIHIADILTLDEYSHWAHERGAGESYEQQLAAYDDWIGEDGRLVIVEFSDSQHPETGTERFSLLVRISNWKAKIVGIDDF